MEDKKRLYVGNLPYSVTSESLKELFSAQGAVEDAAVISDKFSNRSKGFGFVTMSTEEEAAKAIEALNGSEVEGRKIVVNQSRPKQDRPRGGNRGGFGGGKERY